MKKTTLLKILFIIIAVILGILQYLAAVMADFYGVVISPTPVQQGLAIISLVLLLPFSALIFIPIPWIQSVTVGFAFMSVIFWVAVYYRVLIGILHVRRTKE